MDTWWIDEPRLLGSRNPSDRDLERLRDQGFTVLVSLLPEEEQPPRYDVGRAAGLGFARHNVPVEDFRPPTVAQLEEFVRLIASAGSDRARSRRASTRPSCATSPRGAACRKVRAASGGSAR